MLAPPRNLIEYVTVDPDEGFVLLPNAPEALKPAFERWLAELKEYDDPDVLY